MMAQRHEISLLMFENITKKGEDNMLSSCMKISCFRQRITWYFIGVFFNRERILHGSTEVRNFSSSVEKYFTSEQRKQEKYLSTQDEKMSYLQAAIKYSIYYINTNEILIYL